MDIREIPIAKLKEIELYDIVVLQHGLEVYNRDYYFIIESGIRGKSGMFKILFTHCFDFSYRHKYADIEFPDFLRESWDDNLISPNNPGSVEGYWWGQAITHAYPGFSYDPDNTKAKEMTEITGRPMYAISLETEHYKISLIFHDFKYVFLNGNTSISDQTSIPLEKFKFRP